MQTVVNTLCALDGVRHAGLYQEGVLIEGNFPESQQLAMDKSNGVMTQIFFALESVNKSHNELYFGVNGGYLAAFRISCGYVALLITDKKINFPMLSMAIKSASETIKHQIEIEQAEFNRQLYASEPAPVTSNEIEIPIEDNLLPVIAQYTQLLTGYLGPAASILVDDAVNVWKQTYLQTPNNLPYLLAMLEEELDSDDERQAFAIKAAGVSVPAM